MITIDYLYYKLRKKQIDKSKIKLKKISVDTVYEILTKNCWKYGIQYDVLMKNSEFIEIRLQGRKEASLFKFHKSNMVFLEDYYEFKSLMDELESRKGIYITTGVFEQEIYNVNSYLFTRRKVILQDNFQFIKKQILMNPRHKNYLVINHIDFSSYLPD